MFERPGVLRVTGAKSTVTGVVVRVLNGSRVALTHVTHDRVRIVQTTGGAAGRTT